MINAVSNTSPLLYLYRIETIEWLPGIFNTILVPTAVVQELDEGRMRGYDVPDPTTYEWIQLRDAPPSLPEWTALELGAGELAAMSLARQTSSTLLLDDQMVRQAAQTSGIVVWGTLRVILEAKRASLVPNISPYVTRLEHVGMWLSQDIRQRILLLADE